MSCLNVKVTKSKNHQGQKGQGQRSSSQVIVKRSRQLSVKGDQGHQGQVQRLQRPRSQVQVTKNKIKNQKVRHIMTWAFLFFIYCTSSTFYVHFVNISFSFLVQYFNNFENSFKNTCTQLTWPDVIVPPFAKSIHDVSSKSMTATGSDPELNPGGFTQFRTHVHRQLLPSSFLTLPK